MTRPDNAPARAAAGEALPVITQSLITIDDAIAKIRTQIASADLARQQSGKPIDAQWFHNAKTALRHLMRERAELQKAKSETATARRNKIRDAIVEIMRERHDADEWAEVILSAHLRSHNGEAR